MLIVCTSPLQVVALEPVFNKIKETLTHLDRSLNAFFARNVELSKKNEELRSNLLQLNQAIEEANAVCSTL